MTIEEFNYKVELYWEDLRSSLVLLTDGQKYLSSDDNLMNFSIAFWGMYGSLYSSFNSYNKSKISINNISNKQNVAANSKPQTADPGGKVNPKNTEVHSEYSDGKQVLEGEQPGKITGPDIDPQTKKPNTYPHTVLIRDLKYKRIYKARTFGYNFKKIMDIDFTRPTYPNGKIRPFHFVPEQHVYIHDPKGGSPKRGKGEPLNLHFNFNFSINNILH